MSLPSPEEIVERFKARRDQDMFGFEVSEYVPYMGYDLAKEFLNEGVTKEEVADEFKELRRETVLKEMEDYMEFAWDKANGYRSISANRSIMHYIAWTWLAGDEEFSKEIEQEFGENYQYYGKDILRKICDHYGWDADQWDDGVRNNSEPEY